MPILKKITYLLFITILFIQCSNENQYLIQKGKVGAISQETTVQDLRSIFENDSIVSHLEKDVLKNGNSLFSAMNDEYEIFASSGEKLLEISPVDKNDSISKIKSIQIFDPKYKTESGIGMLSLFKDIHMNYTVNKVESSFTSVTLFIDELNATIAIDKDDLGLKKFNREEVKLEQIPDNSKIKYFTIWLN